MLVDYFNYSLQNLKRRRLRSWLTMLGIFVGIATIVALISLGQGLKGAVMDQFAVLKPDYFSITVAGEYDTDVLNPLDKKELKAVESINGVKHVTPRIMQPSQVLYDEYFHGTMVVSIPKGKYLDYFYEDSEFTDIEEGSKVTEADENSIIIGYSLANAEEYDKPIRVGNTVTIEDKEFRVKGILAKKGSFMIDYSSYMNWDVMAELFDFQRDEFAIIDGVIKEGEDIRKLIPRIEKKLQKVRDVKEENQDFEVTAALDSLKDIESTIFAVQLFIYIIAAVSILVGGIGIMNTMYTSVLERTKEIGIMKAIGARNSTIFILFFIESGLLGLVGGIIGVMLGSFLGLSVSEIASLTLGSNLIQSHLSPMLLGGALLFSFILGSISGLLPAIGAAKLHPVEALQKSK